MKPIRRSRSTSPRPSSEPKPISRSIRKAGCPRCGNTGYRGRIGFFQLLEMTPQLEHLASERASRDEIERAAHVDGMRSLWHDGVEKVAAGVTTVEELARVCTV